MIAELLDGAGAELAQRLDERRLRLRERDPVLRALRTRDARLDLAEVELQRLGERGLLRVLGVKEALPAGVGVHQLDQLRGPARELEVAQGLGVDREDRAGRAELRRHVADRRPVGEPEGAQPRPEELHELAHHAALAEHLGHGQHQVGRGRALGELSAELEADHLREQHRDRLAEHRRLGLDPAHAPAQHPQPVDHRRVRVGADQRVGIRLRLARASFMLAAEHHLAQVLEVDLMADPGRRRDHPQVVEGLLPPAQERVPLAVALVVAVGVDVERARVSERVHLNRVVDDQVDRDQWVDLLRIAAELLHRVAHRRQVDQRRHAGEVLHQHPRRLKRDLGAGLGGRIPGGDRLDVGARHRLSVLEAQRVLEQHLQRVRKAGDVVGGLKRVEAEDLVLAARHFEGVAGAEAVLAHAVTPGSIACSPVPPLPDPRSCLRSRR